MNYDIIERLILLNGLFFTFKRQEDYALMLTLLWFELNEQEKKEMNNIIRSMGAKFQESLANSLQVPDLSGYTEKIKAIQEKAHPRALKYYETHVDELYNQLEEQAKASSILLAKIEQDGLQESVKEHEEKLKISIAPYLELLKEKAPNEYEKMMSFIDYAFEHRKEFFVKEYKKPIKAKSQKAKALKYETTKVGKMITERPDNDKFYDDGNIAIWTSKIRQSNVIVYVSLEIEDLKRQGMNVPAIDRLTPFDGEVLCAVISLWEAGNEYVTADMIYRIMAGNKSLELKPKMKDEIFTSLKKLRLTSITINAQEEFETGRNTKARYQGVLLNTEIIEQETVSLNGKEVKDCIHVFRNSPLYDYANGKNQISRVDTAMLDVPVNNTREMIVLKGFLARRVIDIKNPKNKLGDIIKYEAIYEHLQKQDASRDDKKRIRQAVRTILTEWKKKGIIKNFEELDKDNNPPKSKVPIEKVRVII